MKQAAETFYLSPESEIIEKNTKETAFPEVSELVQGSSLEQDFTSLVSLVANVTESHTASLYIADNDEKVLHLGAVQTLSRDFLHNVKIGFGCGLIGWTAENKNRISVCPFEHDATTLVCYREEQNLKSFIAVPVLGKNDELLGVIACDSKKSYAFAKVKEKLLIDCAKQAAALIVLHGRVAASTEQKVKETDSTVLFLENIRASETESELLEYVSEIPQSIVAHDALVVVTTADGGAYYTSSNGQEGHRLLELVCANKRVICGDRSVHALPTDDVKNRSFLSVPFQVLDEEVGSFNLLSKPNQAFSAEEISAIERISCVVSKELEQFHLREMLSCARISASMLGWDSFVRRAPMYLREARQNRVPTTLIRLRIADIEGVEQAVGLEATTQIIEKMSRLVEQVKQSSALACRLFDTQLLILAEQSESQVLVNRLLKLVERMTLGDVIDGGMRSSFDVGSLVVARLKVSMAQYGVDGETIRDLVSATLPSTVAPIQETKQEEKMYVRRRA